MVNHVDDRRDSQGLAVTVALVSSMFLVLLFWIWDSDLLRMLPVILSPIWSPVIVRRYWAQDAPNAARLVVGSLLLGLAVLLGVALLVVASG